MKKPRSEVNPFVIQRRENIQTLKEIIRDNSPVKHDKVTAMMGIYGVTPKTTASYLKILNDLGFINYNGAEKEWSIIEEVSKED